MAGGGPAGQHSSNRAGAAAVVVSEKEGCISALARRGIPSQSLPWSAAVTPDPTALLPVRAPRAPHVGVEYGSHDD